jgi:hypothetical protein
MSSDTAPACVGLLESLKSLLLSPDFKSRHRRNQKDFTRNRCLTVTAQPKPSLSIVIAQL